MAEWLYEDGIGEARAVLVEDGAIVRALVERPGSGPRAGAVLSAHYAGPLIGTRAGLVTLDDATEAMIAPIPPAMSPGRALTVEVIRESVALPGRTPKRPLVRLTDAAPRPAPTLRERLAGPVRTPAYGTDEFEAAGWSELLEEAATGIVAFPGGTLRIEGTEAMTVIDVDGALELRALAVAGAAAAARAIGRLGLGGSIAIDLPTVGDRETRKRAADAFDAAMRVACERTAVNGFGLLQAIVPRPRASLIETIAADPARAAALALYRRAERTPGPGEAVLTAAPSVVAARTDGDDDALARRLGAVVHWHADPGLAPGAGHVHRNR